MPNQASQSPAFPTAEIVHGGFVVGINEDAFLDDGWHEREIRQPDGIPYRGVMPEARFHLPLPVDSEAPHLVLLLTAPVPLLGAPYRGTLYLDNQTLGDITASHDGWIVRRFALPPQTSPDTAQFRLHSATSMTPAQRIPGSQDHRLIACYLSAVWLECPISEAPK